MSVSLRIGLLTLAILAVQRPCPAQNPVFQELVTRGVPMSATELVPLPQPTLTEGMSAAEQRKRIEALADKRYSWEDLTRRVVVAPFILKISQEDETARHLGRRADLWFIAYGDLAKLGTDDFLNDQFKAATEEEDVSGARLLANAELTKRGIPVPVRAEDARYLAAEVTVAERVIVNATTRTVKTQTAESIVAASLLDERFAGDAAFPNRWRSVSRDDNGRRQIGEPHPYTGLGSYVKATRLVEPKGAVFVEYHLAYAEPNAWFNGANLLRSKLAIVAQSTVRKVRRSLASS